MIKDARSRDQRESQKKMDEVKAKNIALQKRLSELEHLTTQDESLRKSFHQVSSQFVNSLGPEYWVGCTKSTLVQKHNQCAEWIEESESQVSVGAFNLSVEPSGFSAAVFVGLPFGKQQPAANVGQSNAEHVSELPLRQFSLPSTGAHKEQPVHD